MGRVACETLLTTGLVVVAGEITTQAYVDIPKLVRETVNASATTTRDKGFDGNTCGVIISIDEQSPDIAHGRRQGAREPRTSTTSTPSSTPRAPATRG